ncbi:MAG TPA: mechanosensitive ion channel family protein [Reyranella sp.]|nr:mechanosensitive ion channel family protein [Reyranella sp.]
MDGLEQAGINAAGTVAALVTTYGLRVVGAIIILIVGWTTARMLYSGIVRACARSTRLDRTITLFLANGARYTLLVFTFVAVLTSFGVETTSFVAVLGALGIAIGLALQGTLSNLAAGIMLVLFRPFRVGDRVETMGTVIVGTIREVNLFYSELDTDNNVRVVVPNGSLWGQIVKVPSRNDEERVDLKFTRPLADDIGRAIDTVREIVRHDRRIKAMAQIGVDSVGEANFTLVARLWVPRREAMQVQFDLNRAIKEEFERNPPHPPQQQAQAAE